jgi:hypothetical protein
LPIAGPTSKTWREEALTEANELEGLAAWIHEHADPDQRPNPELFAYLVEHLQAVRETAASARPTGWRRRLPAWSAAWGGAPVERTRSNLDAVAADLLRLAPRAYVQGEMPGLLAHVNRFLEKSDPRRMRVEDLARKPRPSRSTTMSGGPLWGRFTPPARSGAETYGDCAASAT